MITEGSHRIVAKQQYPKRVDGTKELVALAEGYIEIWVPDLDRTILSWGWLLNHLAFHVEM